MNKVRVFRLLMQLSFALTIIGVLCRVMHWPLGKEFIIIGCTGIAIFSALYFSLKPDKSVFDKIAVVIFPLMSIAYMFGSNRLPYSNEVFFGCAFIGLGYISYQLIQSIRNARSESSGKLQWDRIVLIGGILLIGIGVVLKTLFYPYAREFLLIGLGLSLIYFFWGMFAKDETEESDE